MEFGSINPALPIPVSQTLRTGQCVSKSPAREVRHILLIRKHPLQDQRSLPHDPINQVNRLVVPAARNVLSCGHRTAGVA